MAPRAKSTKSRWRWAGAGLLLATVFCVPGDAFVAARESITSGLRRDLALARPNAARGGGQQASPAEAQDPPQQGGPPQAPVFRTGINVVRVDVIVTDSKTGQPVADLKQGDFQITENDKPQTIDTFKLIKLDGGRVPGPDGAPPAIRSDADEEIEAARDDVRLFGIFLDDYHTRRGASVTVREPVAKFISTQLGPSDMVGLMYPL